ncbi:PH domain-containing protein [Terrabacter carboxydivorans]|uniref:YdbS-like PH domain-containing protein n=1 Tax=Terrabacter carboxydivorans TaxID=619730 RepID=A0ABP5ZSX1_9MICO
MAFLRSTEVPPGLTPILLPGERLVTAVRAHWAKLAEPVATTTLGLVVAVWVDSNVTKSTQAIGTVFWWIFFALLARMLWCLLDWSHNWFVATDKRLLLRYGLISHKVAMMPLLKVTDMSYVRSIPGQFLGFGKFVLESAGQDQALREVKWVPNPDQTYRDICAEIFHIVPPPGDEDFEEIDVLPDDPSLPGGPTRGGGPVGSGGDTAYPDVHRTHNPIQDRLDSYSRAVPIQRPADQPETVYESEDRRQRRRGADTGPIWPRSGD